MNFLDYKQHPLWWSYADLIGNIVSVSEEYKSRHSGQYRLIETKMDQIRPLLFQDLPNTIEDFYFDELNAWQVKLEEYYWVNGFCAFFSGEPITDDSLVRQPSTPEIDERALELRFKFNKLKKKLPKDRWDMADEFFSLARQEVFESRWYVFASGYLWAMETTETVGITGRAENIEALNKLLT